MVKPISHEVDQAPETLEDLDRINNDLVTLGGETVSRSEAVVAMRINGMNWTRIADLLDFSGPVAARRAFERILAKTVGDEERDQARFLNRRRLERVLSSLISKAANPDDPDHLPYAKVFLLYVDRLIKLDGADAPTKVDVTYTPSEQEFDATIERINSQRQGEQPVELDVIRGELA